MKTPNILNTVFGLVSFLVLFPTNVFSFDLTVSASAGGPRKTYNLSWDEATKSTDTAVTTYCVYEEFGTDGVDIIGGNLRGCVIDETTFIIPNSCAGDRSFIVTSADSFDAAFDSISNEVAHYFIHDVFRTDGDGTQRGVDQLWNFTYKLDADSYFTMRVFPPGTTFSEDADGIVTGAAGAATPTKVIVSSTPRSGELADGSISMEDIWDSRDSSGSIVTNGIYYILMQANLDDGQSCFNESNDGLRAGNVYTVPVDILRILDLEATGITLTNAQSQISYTVTGDSLVRMIIAQPGSGFSVDSNGDIQPVNLTTGLMDTSLIVSTRTFQRKAGSNVETWDGTTSTGSIVASGVYPVGISASDEYGNHAIDNSGNDGPIFTTITLERSAGSSSGSSASSDSTPPTLSSVSPANGSVFTSPVSTITIVLADADSALNLGGATVVVRDPNNSVVPGSVSNNGTDTLFFFPTTSLDTSGGYSITVTAYDAVGNSADLSASFVINIRLASEELKSSLSLFPNPAKNTTVNIRYTLSLDAAVEINVFNILGERVYSVTTNESQGTVTNTWNLRNNGGERVGSGLYLVRVKAIGAGSKGEAIKKLVVVQ